jgi:hypothetical protein
MTVPRGGSEIFGLLRVGCGKLAWVCRIARHRLRIGHSRLRRRMIVEGNRLRDGRWSRTTSREGSNQVAGRESGGSSVGCREKGSEEGRGGFQLYALGVDEFTQ